MSNRTTKHVFCKATLLLFASSWAYGQSLPIYESFPYSTGATEATSLGNWSEDGSNIGNPFQTVASASDNGASLAYAGLLAPAGNRVVCTFGADRGFISRSFSAVSATGSALYGSCLLKVNTAPNTGTTISFMQFRKSVTLVFRGNIFLRPSANAGFFNLGLRDSGFGAIQYIPTDYPIGQTVLVVLGVNFVSGSNNDYSSVWVNPATGLASPSGAALTSSNSGQADTPVDLIFFTTGVGTAGVYQIDEVRIATSWTGVTPAALAGVSDWEMY